MALAKATRVDLGPLGRAWITKLIGQGGQGHVYEVQPERDGPRLALKWYRTQSATEEQRHGVEQLLEHGSPHERFLWPLSLARIPGSDGFGYVMALRDPTFLELSHLLSNVDTEGRPLDVSFATTIEMCRQVAHSFLRLHSRGLCYRDISFGNVFFDPARGDILICDNDNVGVDNGRGRILGTPFFMAPEVVRDTTYSTLPNTETDRHSLAVLLFYILFMGHPLEGEATQDGLRDMSWLIRHFGTHPVFCMDPVRGDNRPPEIVAEYWRIYPRFVRDLFTQAFTSGLDDPSRRVTEGQWIKAMGRLRDALYSCPHCGASVFWEAGETGRRCRGCAHPLQPSLLLHVGRRRLPVSTATLVRSDHLGRVEEPEPVAMVLAHPREPGRFGLHNLGRGSWHALYDGGVRRPVPPGDTVELVHGLRVEVETDAGSQLLMARRADRS